MNGGVVVGGPALIIQTYLHVVGKLVLHAQRPRKIGAIVQALQHFKFQGRGILRAFVVVDANVIESAIESTLAHKVVSDLGAQLLNNGFLSAISRRILLVFIIKKHGCP